ncbi:unnamed protein product [Prorocentrum cordatum]|uniref:Beta-galactosidase n=2 Tax=Prorocentrum cordatum TaxID=2364126 RepID=A0ABN9XWW9_9DINO|nr:unnamed protein product [Polarella glacialis]
MAPRPGKGPEMPATATAFRLEVDLFRGARCFGRNPPRTEKVWGWSDAGRQVPCGGEGGPLRITILERASYCSGRFGAGLRFSASASAAAGGGGLEGQAAAAAGLWCNLGSQVLSAVNPSGAHANAGEAGHGMRRGDLAGAWRLAIRLRDEGLLLGPVGQEQEIDGYPLACTDERMWYPDLWYHFVPSPLQGLHGVLRFLVRESGADVQLRRRVLGADLRELLAGRCADPGTGRAAAGKVVVVLAVPAPEALLILQESKNEDGSNINCRRSSRISWIGADHPFPGALRAPGAPSGGPSGDQRNPRRPPKACVYVVLVPLKTSLKTSTTSPRSGASSPASATMAAWRLPSGSTPVGWRPPPSATTASQAGAAPSASPSS